MIGQQVLELDYLISVENDIGFEVIFVDVPHELTAISARSQDTRFAVGIDRLVFLPYRDNSFDAVLPGRNHSRDSAALSAQPQARSIDTDTGVDIAFSLISAAPTSPWSRPLIVLRLMTD
jgi:hypothetical protein